MENASKALIVAGGVLIAVIILGIAVRLNNSGGLFLQSYQEKIENDNLNSFNKKILNYARNINAQDMVSLINLVDELNEKYSGISSYRKITIYLNSSEINWNEYQKIENMQETKAEDEGIYKFKSVSYYDSGYIKSISFKK